MSSRHVKSATGGSKPANDPPKKQSDKPRPIRQASVDKSKSGTASLPSSPLSNPQMTVHASAAARRAAAPLTRSGTTSLPSSPLNKSAPAPVKKTGSPSLAKKDAPPKGKVAPEKKTVGDSSVRGRNVKGATGGRNVEGATGGRSVEGATGGRSVEGATGGRSVEGATGGRNVEGATGGRNVEGATGGRNVEGATGGRNVEGKTERSSQRPLRTVSPIRSSRSRVAESGTFQRRQPIPEVKITMDRPDVSPRSRKIQESANHFLEVKRLQTSAHKGMEGYVADQLNKVQGTLRQVEEISTKISRCDDNIRVENDKLNHLIGRSAVIFQDLDETLSGIRDKMAEFMDRTERGAVEVDIALKKVIDHICNYSKEAKKEVGDGPDDGKGDGPKGDGPGGTNGRSGVDDRNGGAGDGKPGEGSDPHIKSEKPGNAPEGNLKGEKSCDGSGDRHEGEEPGNDNLVSGQPGKGIDDSNDRSILSLSKTSVEKTTEDDNLDRMAGRELEEDLVSKKSAGEKVYYTQISKPRQGCTDQGEEALVQSKESFDAVSKGLSSLEGQAVIERIFEHPSNINTEEIKKNASIIYRALEDTVLEKQIAKGNLTEKMVEDVLGFSLGYIMHKKAQMMRKAQSETTEKSPVKKGKRRAKKTEACSSGSPRKSLDAVDSMNALISVLSPIKSGAHQHISRSAKTDTMELSETTASAHHQNSECAKTDAVELSETTASAQQQILESAKTDAVELSVTNVGHSNEGELESQISKQAEPEDNKEEQGADNVSSLEPMVDEAISAEELKELTNCWRDLCRDWKIESVERDDKKDSSVAEMEVSAKNNVQPRPDQPAQEESEDIEDQKGEISCEIVEDVEIEAEAMENTNSL